MAEYFAKDRIGERWTNEFNGERHQIDHILISHSVRDAFKKPKAHVLAVTKTLSNGKPASDHRPFVVTLEAKGN